MAEKKKESFTDAFSRARQENPSFIDGSRKSQGINPAGSLGYQAGNIANQVGRVAGGLGDLITGANDKNPSALGSAVDVNPIQSEGQSPGLSLVGTANAATPANAMETPTGNDSSNSQVTTAPDEQAAPTMGPQHQTGPDANIATASIPGMDYSPDRKTGPTLLTNVGPGNEGGRAIGDIGAVQTGIQEEQRQAYGLGKNLPKMGSNGVFQVDNMDVKFDEGTDPEAAKRFLRKPFQATQRRSGMNPMQRAAPGKQPEGMPELITKQSHPHIDAKTAQALNTSMINGWQSRMNIGETGKNTLANTKLSGENTLANTNASKGLDAEAANEAANKDLIAEAYRLGAPMSDAATQVYNTDGKGKVDLSSLSSVPRNTTPRTRTTPLPTFVQPKFDDDGVKRPGTGVWETYNKDGQQGQDFSAFDNYNPKSGMNKAQNNLVQSLIAGQDFEALDLLTERYPGLDL